VSVPKLGKLPEPKNLGALKAEVERRWGTIDLLDRNSPTRGTVSDAHMLLLTSYQALHDFATELVSAMEMFGGTARLPIDEFS
jgi:hypothetical protein